MRQPPRNLRPMETAPKDGTIVDLWSPRVGGWVKEVWWADEHEKEFPDLSGWVTLCPPPFTGWRPTPGISYP